MARANDILIWTRGEMDVLYLFAVYIFVIDFYVLEMARTVMICMFTVQVGS